MKRLGIIGLLLFLPLLGAAQTLLHLPAQKLGDPVLFGSRIVDVSQSWGKVFAPGQRNAFPRQMHFELAPDGREVLLLPVQPGEGRRRRGPHRDMHPVHFPLVETLPDGTLVLDVSEYFSSYPRQVSAIPPRMLEQDPQVEGKVAGVREEAEYLQVTGVYRYASGLEVKASCYFLFLPKDPMPTWTADASRVGYYSVEGFGPEGKQTLSQRWDLRRGPIVFYVDKAFPEAWYPYIKEGVEDWNRAFERIGLGKVISVLPEPDDASFDRNSPLVNMVRYMDVEEANAKGDVLCDPRTGEILQGDILWWKNVKNLICGWRYVQTGAADPRARLHEYPIEMLGPMIRYSVCHEMGHVLGLGHNMGASWAYPTAKLRNVAFTKQYGTTASVMDYARYNHLATAADVRKGVSLLPPRLGPYDYYAIACGYGSEETPAGEYCYFAPFISAAISPDPSAQSETLGNDLVASSAAGIRNCRALLKLDGLDENRLALLRKQYYRYLWLSLSNLGGSVKGEPVSWKVQKKTLIFVFRGLDEVPPELADAEQDKRIRQELTGNFLPKRVEENGGKKTLDKYYKIINQHQ